MDLVALPDDFFVTVSQFTKTAHRDEYPDVDPTSQALSQEGKVVVITGASSGLGRQVRTSNAKSPFSIQIAGVDVVPCNSALTCIPRALLPPLLKAMRRHLF
jgi:hypothetical protein